MSIAKVEVTEFQDAKDLKPLLQSQGTCLSVYMTLGPNAKANDLEWQETIRTIKAQVSEPLTKWEEIPPEEVQGKAIAVFHSPETFQLAWLQEPVPSRAILAPHFYIRPLLPALAKPKTFYILALSQKDVRLLRCTGRKAEEVPLPNGTATSFDVYMDTAKPDHVRSNQTSAGKSAGHSKGVTGTTDTEREDKGEYLAHFFKQIDHKVNELLRGSSAPVILAAVEYELAQYRSLNTYPHLLDEDVQGAPNGLKAGEMHSRALDALNRSYENKVAMVLAEYNHKVGGGASNRMKDVVTAAHDGRVLNLIVSDTLMTPGIFDEHTHSVKGRATGTSEEEDLINDAAIQTILHGGHVFSVSNQKMPDGAPLAAVFRY